MDAVVAALAAQQDELSAVLRDLGAVDWRRPTRCDGWDVGDVVLHLAQTNDLAIGSATGGFDEALSRFTGGMPRTASVDEGAAAMVQRERGAAPSEVLRRWSSSADQLVAVLASGDMSRRVRWVAGDLSVRTLATTRLSETWIHSGDVAGALGIALADTDRLRLIARLAWRTLPYAFASAGSALSGPVAFHLTAPNGGTWDYVPDGTPVTTISGSAAELCGVAARRVKPSDTALRGEGPDVDAILALLRTYA